MFKHTLNVSVDKSLVSIVGVGSQVLTSDHPELDCCLPLLTMWLGHVTSLLQVQFPLPSRKVAHQGTHSRAVLKRKWHDVCKMFSPMSVTERLLTTKSFVFLILSDNLLKWDSFLGSRVWRPTRMLQFAKMERKNSRKISCLQLHSCSHLSLYSSRPCVRGAIFKHCNYDACTSSLNVTSSTFSSVAEAVTNSIRHNSLNNFLIVEYLRSFIFHSFIQKIVITSLPGAELGIGISWSTRIMNSLLLAPGLWLLRQIRKTNR
jgi:hypothetical protein